MILQITEPQEKVHSTNHFKTTIIMKVVMRIVSLLIGINSTLSVKFTSLNISQPQRGIVLIDCNRKKVITT